MKYFLLVLPLVCAHFDHDGITIIVEPGQSEANTTITHEGEDIKILDDLDMIAFNLTKDNLDKAVTAYSGEKATDIFIKSPTPWNNLYKTYNWSEVKREFRIKDIKLINVTKEEINLAVREYTNNDTMVKNINASVYIGYVTFKSRHYWSGSNIAAKIKYEVTRPYIPPLQYAYISKVGEDYFGSGLTSITYGGTNAKFALYPQQTAKRYLKAVEVTARFMIEYETKLTGDVALNYANKHDGHHFWAYDINKVLSASKMNVALTTEEYVEVMYLVEESYKTEVVDEKFGVEIKFTPF